MTPFEKTRLAIGRRIAALGRLVGIANGPGFATYVGDDTLLAATIFGRLIYLDAKDLSITPHLAAYGCWERSLYTLVKRTLGPGDIFIDIGANCGFFTLLGADLVGPQGVVLAFEPQARLAGLMRKTMSVGGFGDAVRVYEAAVGESDGTARLGHSRNHLGAASMTPNFGDADVPAETVPVVRLDDVLDALSAERGHAVRPTMMKIDVEGYEYFVWKGMARTLARREPLTIAMEFSPESYQRMGQNSAGFLEEMLAHGFQVTRLEQGARLKPFGQSDVADLLSHGGNVELVLRRR